MLAFLVLFFLLAGVVGSSAQTRNPAQSGSASGADSKSRPDSAAQPGNAAQSGKAAKSGTVIKPVKTTQTLSGRYVDQVKAKMDRAEKILIGDGFERTHDRHYAKVKTDKTEESVLTLKQDVDYAIVTVCDNDCTNVDAKIFNKDNQELDMDTTGDDFPVLDIRPPETGEYKIVISVPGCSARRCTIGIGVYGKDDTKATPK